MAEVLITLGIIGVVSALTIPNVVQNYQKHVAETKLKVAYQLFSEVIERAKLDNGGIIEVPHDLALSLTNTSADITSMYFDPYFDGAEKYNGKGIRVANKANSWVYIVQNYNRATCIPKKGFCYWVFNHSSNYRDLHIDINGPKGPNIAGRDVFSFRLSGTAPTYTIDSLKPVKSRCDKSSDNSAWNGFGCAELIINNGWKIPDDYPW